MIQKTRKSQQGASIVHWLIALLALLGFGALAIDLNTVYVSQAQLQNAADAGALEGARVLYCSDGSLNLNAGDCGNDSSGNPLPSANQAATAAAQANVSQGVTVQVVGAETGRGHWEFRSDGQATDANGIERGGIFSLNDAEEPAPLLDEDGEFRTFQDLNQDPDEINAYQVVTSNPVGATFAKLLGIGSFPVRARAVAYVGFSGTIKPGEMDMPLAICRDSIDGQCTVGRMISQDEETGGWTNFQQPSLTSGSCSGAASASEVNNLVSDCYGESNPAQIFAGVPMQTTNGEVQSAFSKVYGCYMSDQVGQGNNAFPGRLSEFDTDVPSDGQPDLPWKWTLPVIDCSEGITGACNVVLGAVQVDVLWMFDDTTNLNKLNDDAPRKMTRTGSDGNPVSWDAEALACSQDPEVESPPNCIDDPSDGQQRWDSFVETFDLRQPDPTSASGWKPAEWRQKSLYFAPDCKPTELIGSTGGSNFGIRAANPVLVF